MKDSMLKRLLKSLRFNEEKISMALGGLVVVVVGILVYNYFASVNKASQLADQAAQEAAEMAKTDTYTVAKGDHLWAIAQKQYQDGYKWVEIAKANNLTNADVITEGTELVLPKLETAEVKTEVMAEVSTSVETEVMQANQYTVQKGDSLWNISVRAYGDGYQWSKVWEANKTSVPNPDIVEVGTQLTLPR